MRLKTCPKCDSERIIPDVYVEDKGMSNVPWSLSVRVDEKPDALVFKGRHKTALEARICGECGFAELYAEDPQALYAAYAKASEREASE